MQLSAIHHIERIEIMAVETEAGTRGVTGQRKNRRHRRENALTVSRLLNLALGSQFAQLLRTLHGIQRGEFEVIGGSPKPQASGLRHALFIEADADGDILVANGVEVAG